MHDNVKPFLKWVGGKRQLLSQMEDFIPENYNNYFEPFLGAGALLFFLKPNMAYINDMNFELINVYNVLKDNIEELIIALEKNKNNNSKDYYYCIRAWDRSSGYSKRSNISKAARFIYMNKVGFNGLYRVNSKGQFNVPYGIYKNPNIVDKETLYSVSEYLNKNHIIITSQDFESAVSSAEKGDFVYFDPPYHPINKTSSFVEYQKGGFGIEEQIRLKLLSDSLVKKGVKVILSNSNTDFIINLYKNKIDGAKSEVDYYFVELVNARRSINSNAKKRGSIKEVLIISKD